jgi:ankyrin repeat protein
MSLYSSLPKDIHRIIACYLTEEEIYKIHPDIQNNDILWKIKAQALTEVSIDYKLLYSLIANLKKRNMLDAYFQLEYFKEYLSKVRWSEDVYYGDFINNEVFLSKYIDAPDKDGQSVLLYLCSSGDYMKINLSEVEKLIKMGANVNYQVQKGKNYDIIGWTPLIATFNCRNPNLNIIKLLLEAGANVLLKDSYNESALDIAKRKHMYVELLEKYL